MLFRTIVSAFYLPPAVDDDLAGLVRRAGMTDFAPFDETVSGSLGFHDADRPVLGGTWDAFGATWAIVDDAEGLRILQLYSQAALFFDAEREIADAKADEDDWPLAGYLRTFREACLALAPIAAFLDTRAHFEDEAWVDRQGSRRFVLELAPMAAACNADALAQRRFSLLYLDGRTSKGLTPGLPWSDREEVEMPSGRLLFARSGPTRMS
jgi:hypothetical protein